MHIRKLEIHGFKSFPDRVVFHFSQGISGIVGPNGCGKSNVLDAVKWCVGEQSARELRGAAMEDVVFTGTAVRPAMALAQVSLTLGGAPFAGEWARFDEVVVTRRMVRGGGSEYRINQQRVRLKDVHELFLDTGAGNRFYSFIEQGRIGAVIAASAEERRELIEEAAGTSRYKARRTETLARLDATLQNLERSVHVVEELGVRLEQLARQVDRAARFRRFRAIAAQASLVIALARYAGLRADRRVLTADLRAAATELASLERQLGLFETGLRREKEQAEVAEGVVGGLRDQLAELEATRRELESARQYQERERADLAERARRLAQDLEHAALRQAGLDDERAEAERLVEAWLAAAEEARAAVATHEERSMEVGGRLATARESRERSRKDLLDRRAAAERLGARAETLAQQQVSIREDLEGRDRDLRAAGQEAERLQRTRTEVEAQRAAARARQEQVRADLSLRHAARQAAEAALAEAAACRQHAEQAAAGLERELAQAHARRDLLRDLAERHEGLGDASRRVLGSIPGAFALVEELEVPDALVDLLALALGERADLVVVPDRDRLARAAEVAGQGSIWLLVDDPGQPLPSEGLGVGIGGTERARRALARAIGRFTQEPGLPEALDRAAAGWTAVSADGARVEPRGLVRAGRGGLGSTGVLARRRALADAERAVVAGDEQVATAAAGRRAAEEEEARLRAVRDGALREVEAGEQELRRAELESSGLEHRWRHCAESEERQRRLLFDLDRRAGQQRGRVEAVAAELAEARAQRDAALREERAAADALEAGEGAVRAIAAEHAVRQDDLQRAREDLAAGEVRVAGARQAAAAATRALDQAREAASRAADEARIVAARQVDLGQQERVTEQSITEVAGRQEQAAARLVLERRSLAEARRRVEQAEAGLARARESREAGAAAVQGLEVRLGEVRARIDLVKRQGEEELGVSLPAHLDRLEKNGQLVLPHGLTDDARLPLDLKRLPAVEDVVVEPRQLDDPSFVESWSEQLTQARKRIEGLGDVNLTAVEEYLEVQARHEDLLAQRRDLEASVQEIRGALARINRTCRERFREAFDEVNVHFGDLFGRLSGGGQAGLVLTDEEDLLETGVDIAAQPPGKRLRSLNLLSGGEKALVALALVFALFRVRPSPFCVLDEVDAPLDDGNGERFNALLRDMARCSQFIVISHNKKTIECADTLYGVTMQEPGVSRLVTVQMA